MSYGKHMNDLSVLAQAVWGAVDLENKKTNLKKMVNTFKYAKSKNDFNKIIDNTSELTKLDEIAANLALNKTDKVVAMLPR